MRDITMTTTQQDPAQADKARQAAAKQRMAQEDADVNSEGDSILGTGMGAIGGIIGAYFGGPAGAAAGFSAGQHLGKGISEMATNRDPTDDLTGGILSATGLIKKKRPDGSIIDDKAGAGDEVPDSTSDTGDVSGVA